MITSQEYKRRRQHLSEQLCPGAIAIVPSAQEILRNGDAHYRFRQDSDFYYLTGFEEPNAVLFILAGGKEESYLFNQPSDPLQEQWTGRRLGQANASSVLGVTEAYSIEQLDMKLPQLLNERTAVYCLLGRYPSYEKAILAHLNTMKRQARRGIHIPEALYDLEPLLGEMRLHKTELEIDLMRKAATISVNAHKRAMQYSSRANFEYELEAELIHSFLREGCHSVAYNCIVAGGANSCVLHYSTNNQPLHEGDLILIDAGCEYRNYAADITRTFPKNGRYSVEQRAIYEIVLKAQQAGIAAIKPGLAWNEIQRIIVSVITTGLQALGLLEGNIDDLIHEEAYKAFYMHSSGHWLGLDVHDVGRYKINGEWRILEQGMVLTVEPGIYIPPGLAGVAECWWNIGVRIEDDILVTEESHENLTAELPVEINDIEALMGDK